jgi:ABC-2 type transport system ATP-binding protein
MSSLVETHKLARRFGSFTAVEGLDLNIESGDIFSLLGPNGAGKSTVIKMLTTLLPPTSGDAHINGLSIKTQPNEVRKIIGYVPQLLSADGSLTGYENLLLFAKLYDIPTKEAKKRVEEEIAFMGLEDAAHKLVKTYSGGMIRRLEIAQSILHRPKILFLDEPTVGLDPIGVKMVWEHILELKTKFNITILLTTHIMEEVDRLSNKVAFLSRGKLVAQGSPAELKKSIDQPEATLEDVFIHYTAETLQSEGDYKSIAQGRKKSKRLG